MQYKILLWLIFGVSLCNGSKVLEINGNWTRNDFTNYSMLDKEIDLARSVLEVVKSLLTIHNTKYDNSTISISCQRDLDYARRTWSTLKKCRSNECFDQNEWVLKILDAQGQQPSGIRLGNAYWLGHYRECESVNAKDLNSLARFVGSHSLIVIPTSVRPRVIAIADIPWHVGICLPQSCSSADIYAAILGLTQLKHFELLQNDTIRIKENVSILILLCFIIIICFFLLVATFIKRKVDKMPIKDSRLQFLSQFSILTNASKLFSVDGGVDQIMCLHGIRVMAFFLVVLCHIDIVDAIGDNSVEFQQNIWKDPVGATILNGAYAVDTFFLISGLLLSYNWLHNVSKKKTIRINSRRQWLAYYVHRYLRLTPCYAIILWISSDLFLLFGNGPLFQNYWKIQRDACHTYWWSNLLYISNIWASKCMGHGWYLAAEFQLYLLTPPILIALYRRTRLAFVISFIAIIASVTAGGIMGFVSDGPPNLITTLQGYGNNARLIFGGIILNPGVRGVSYVLGLLLGYYLNNRTKIIAWVTVTITLIILIYIPFVGHYPPIANAIYTALHHLVFTICLIWIVYACVTGNAEWLNQMLSWRGWLPISRLTYTAYLIHIPIREFMFVNSDRMPHFRSTASTINLSVINAFWSLLFGALAHIAFEAPGIILDKEILKWMLREKSETVGAKRKRSFEEDSCKRMLLNSEEEGTERESDS